MTSYATGTISASTANASGNWALWSQILPTASGQVASLSYSATSGVSTNVYMSLYTDNSGSPGNFITSGTAGSVVAGINSVTLSSPPSIVAGTPYWIGYSSAAYSQIYQATSPVDAASYYDQINGSWPASNPSPYSPNNYAVWFQATMVVPTSVNVSAVVQEILASSVAKILAANLVRETLYALPPPIRYLNVDAVVRETLYAVAPPTRSSFIDGMAREALYTNIASIYTANIVREALTITPLPATNVSLTGVSGSFSLTGFTETTSASSNLTGVFSTTALNGFTTATGQSVNLTGVLITGSVNSPTTTVTESMTLPSVVMAASVSALNPIVTVPGSVVLSGVVLTSYSNYPIVSISTNLTSTIIMSGIGSLSASEGTSGLVNLSGLLVTSYVSPPAVYLYSQLIL